MIVERTFSADNDTYQHLSASKCDNGAVIDTAARVKSTRRAVPDVVISLRHKIFFGLFDYLICTPQVQETYYAAND